MKSSGFTLVELMVAISIIAILTAISIPIYQGSRSQLALQRAANKLAQDIRRAQEKAMAAKKFGEAVPQGGYGVYFNSASSSSYVLFANSTNTSHLYDPSEKVEEIFLNGDVKISQISPLYFGALHIVFVPPDPETWINESTTIAATITLKIGNSTTSVKVLPSGLIYVK